MPKVGIIVNLNSRKYVLSKKNIVGTFEKIGGDFVAVRYTKSIDDLVYVADEFKNMGIDYVAPSGGDGTLHHVITQFYKVYGELLPPVLILKSGTMNNVATSLGIKGDATAILHRAIKLLKTGSSLQTTVRYTMNVNNTFCFLFGNGLTSDFLETYYAIGKSYIKLIRLIMGSIFDAMHDRNPELFRGFQGNVMCDGEELPFSQMLAILAGTVETIGMGFYPLYRANEKEKCFHAIICAMKPKEVAKQIMKLKKGIPIDHPLYVERVIQKLSIHSSTPFTYTMDGDLYHANGTLVVTSGIPIKFVIV